MVTINKILLKLLPETGSAFYLRVKEKYAKKQTKIFFFGFFTCMLYIAVNIYIPVWMYLLWQQPADEK